MNDVREQAHRLDDEAPGVLSRSVGGGTPPPPIRQSTEVVGMHEAWARVHADDSKGVSGVREKARARIVTLASEVAGPAQRDDRALIGALIQAVEVLAQRCDEIANRVAELESMVEEVVDVYGEDLVRLRAVLSGTTSATLSTAASERPRGQGTETPDGYG